MDPQAKIEVNQSSPSFNCYSFESSTSKSIAKVMDEETQSENIEFSFNITKDDVSDSQNWTAFPIFNRAHENKSNDDLNHSLAKLFIDDLDESSSYSSSEVDELENIPSGTFCVWRPKATVEGEADSSQFMTKCKKSSSTGSGSKRWRFRYLLRRSNSEGKEPMVLLASKKTDSPKVKRSSVEVLKVAGKWKAQTPVHEQFYVQRRAENEEGKRKSYLPYRKDLVGLFGNVNGIGKMLPF